MYSHFFRFSRSSENPAVPHTFLPAQEPILLTPDVTAPGMSIEHSATEANYRTLSLGAQHIYRHTDLEQTEKDTTNDESITVVKQKVTDYKKTVDVRCVCVCVWQRVGRGYILCNKFFVDYGIRISCKSLKRSMGYV